MLYSALQESRIESNFFPIFPNKKDVKKINFLIAFVKNPILSC